MKDGRRTVSWTDKEEARIQKIEDRIERIESGVGRIEQALTGYNNDGSGLIGTCNNMNERLATLESDRTMKKGEMKVLVAIWGLLGGGVAILIEYGLHKAFG